MWRDAAAIPTRASAPAARRYAVPPPDAVALPPPLRLLEAELAAVELGGGDPALDELEDAAAELDVLDFELDVAAELEELATRAVVDVEFVVVVDEETIETGRP